MKFKSWFEMASFTLPNSIKINGQNYSAIDMQFELDPKTVNKDGKVMNQGSKFVARFPFEDKYLIYDGQGNAGVFPKKQALRVLEDEEYEKIPDNWWVKAKFLD
jgi:hypothetical protein